MTSKQKPITPFRLCMAQSGPETSRRPAEGQEPERRVATAADIMSRTVVSVRPDLSLDAAAQLFLETRLRAAPVIDERGRVQGMLEEQDLHSAIQIPKNGTSEAARSVYDVMQPAPLLIPARLSVTQASAIMVQNRSFRLLVVDHDESVVGILSASDILWWIARSEGYVLSPPAHY